MSVAAKTRLTEITIGTRTPQRFKVPEQAVKGLVFLLKDYKLDEESDDDYIDADDALKHLHKETSKAAVRLRGFRHREGWTQVQLAKKLKTTQSVVASMERARRPISYRMAQKLAKLFDTLAEAFLEA